MGQRHIPGAESYSLLSLPRCSLHQTWLSNLQDQQPLTADALRIPMRGEDQVSVTTIIGLSTGSVHHQLCSTPGNRQPLDSGLRTYNLFLPPPERCLVAIYSIGSKTLRLNVRPACKSQISSHPTYGRCFEWLPVLPLPSSLLFFQMDSGLSFSIPFRAPCILPLDHVELVFSSRCSRCSLQSHSPVCKVDSSC